MLFWSKRPKAALAAILGVTFSLIVFSLYVYEGHRFHWPALALLVPALATTLELLSKRKRESLALGVAVMLGVLLTTMALPRERLGYQPWSEAMLAFFESPAEHWGHLRTSNPIESVFATVRHRTVRTKGALSQKTAKLMVFTLIQAASKKWLRLKGRNQLPKLIEGTKFNDGVEVTDDAANRAA